MGRCTGRLAVTALLAGAVLIAGCDDEGPGCPVTVESAEGALCADLAETANERLAGLRGREGLGVDEALVIVFPVTAEPCISNEGVGFAIDVAWLDEAHRVVAVATFAADDPRVVCNGPARYVVETASGARRIVPGAELRLQPDPR